MKVLFLGRNDERRVGSGQYYLRKALAKRAKVVCCGPKFQNKPVEMDVSKLEKIYDPDVILIQGFWPYLEWQNLAKTKAPKAIFFSDPHTAPKQRIKWIEENRIDASFHPYTQSLGIEVDLEYHGTFWLPWCANTNVFKDYYGEDRPYDVALLGTFGRTFYPLRTKIKNELLERKNLNVFHKPRPKHGHEVNPATAFVRENYARAIARCKMMIFDGGIFYYAVQKYFEAMACKTLALAPLPHGYTPLRFKDEYNIVSINEDNFLEKIFYYLDHEDKRKRIVSHAYSTIQKYHTCKTRSWQLLDFLTYLAETRK